LIADYSVTPMQALERSWILLELLPRDRLLRITKEEAQLSKQEVTRVLVRGLAHEIKNPLGGIRGAAQLLARELGEPALQDYTDVIIQEADRLRNLVDRMLGPYQPPRLTPISIHEITEHVCSLVQAEAQGKLDLLRDYDPSIPDLLADREQLIQAVLNIVRNAMQALMSVDDGRRGQITLRTRTLRQFTIGPRRHRLVCRLEITDNGPGIAPGILDSIFYPMVSGRAEGTGLGLSITQNIITRHQGLIECDSTPGHTTFTLFLPLPGEDA
ncbi:MAG: PAS domain-containing sensor histidine kinase, partial [Gammaproteobacteria bacterium]|nr:PAS domain-containing sensor histidine kinase [Gammaproteobacteria bacterium]